MPRRGENIYKRKDGRWEGRYIKFSAADGKAKYGFIYSKTYAEVKTKLETAKRMKSKGWSLEDIMDCTGLTVQQIATI